MAKLKNQLTISQYIFSGDGQQQTLEVQAARGLATNSKA